jgi:NAD(P)-dependent dehydrogenase (short-subunit alcohol dehydrogenase family)
MLMTKQKVWFVTGASRGFGLEIVKEALGYGDLVVATVRNSPELLASKLGNPDNLSAVVLDVTNEQQANEAAGQAIKRFGRIDVLVNNAGFGLLSAVEEATNEEVKRNFEVNVFGLLNVTRAVLPYMRKERSGHVINISSVGGLTGNIGWGVYGSTKFAVEGLTEAMAKELAPLGIHATVVEPGLFRTEFLDVTSLTRTSRVIDDYAGTVGEMRSFATEVNKKQPGDPVKLAKALILLANAEKPPVHLPMGKDTLTFFKEKMDLFEKDIEVWFDVITGTDHDDVIS